MGSLISVLNQIRSHLPFQRKFKFALGFQKADDERIERFIQKHFIRDNHLTLEGGQIKVTVSKDGDCIDIPLKLVYPSQSGENLKAVVGDDVYNEHKFIQIECSIQQDTFTDKDQTRCLHVTERSGFASQGLLNTQHQFLRVEILSFRWLEEVKKYKRTVIHITDGCEILCDDIFRKIPKDIKVLSHKYGAAGSVSKDASVDKDIESDVIFGVRETNSHEDDMQTKCDADRTRTESEIEDSSHFIHNIAEKDCRTCDAENPYKCLNMVVTLKRTRVQSDAESALEQAHITEEMKENTVLLIFHKIMGSKTIDDVISIMYKNEDVLKTFHVPFRVVE